MCDSCPSRRNVLSRDAGSGRGDGCCHLVADSVVGYDDVARELLMMASEEATLAVGEWFLTEVVGKKLMTEGGAIAARGFAKEAAERSVREAAERAAAEAAKRGLSKEATERVVREAAEQAMETATQRASKSWQSEDWWERRWVRELRASPRRRRRRQSER